jgi:hypothetical protein
VGPERGNAGSGTRVPCSRKRETMADISLKRPYVSMSATSWSKSRTGTSGMVSTCPVGPEGGKIPVTPAMPSASWSSVRS